ncbi:hypothetical protein GQ43DRAFT_381725 [Delitschia confertaspora ATCC 74209]|uniref:Uncharacterized protein n=1 Tax=Delitschia confertaspora ATCC 74209 TaxID=1513339 RepID=A0A9P4MRM6_9PLEO|nr:hypothetical protein GQ43DRAFT_381725 [Delitschia confertaspora ATCC 74209]
MDPVNYSVLLEEDHDSHDYKADPSILSPKAISIIGRKLKYHRILSFLLLLTNICFFGLWQKSKAISTTCIRPELVYTPAKNIIRYEKKRLFRDIENNVYTGEPRPEHDEAWAKLIEPITIKVSERDLNAINATSIAFKDGSGYIAETAVYHELHCIKRVRRHLHLSHYYPNMTEDQRLREGPHIDHCLEYWREAAMCRGDTTLATFQWAEGKPFSHVYSDHECVNWKLLDIWARGRMVDMSTYDMLEGILVK